ncbi:MAG: phosphoribosyl-AMP cyclohydrolase [Candidatus Firestonebacteria bacterium]|nr:phosphoribosyl-AMP cyclohydrolase [Candidatus Firestonebacteria bacterium]
MKIPEGMKYDEHGLLTAVVQDHITGEVLMLAFMNAEALRLTLETRIVHYFSRSRQKLWKKGESSGHVQHVKEIRLDCDQDAVLIKIDQVGGACHDGYRSCFYRVIEGEGVLRVDGLKVFDPKQTYKS